VPLEDQKKEKKERKKEPRNANAKHDAERYKKSTMKKTKTTN